VIKAHSQLLSRRSTSTQQGFSAWMRFWEFPRLRTETAGRANPFAQLTATTMLLLLAAQLPDGSQTNFHYNRLVHAMPILVECI